MSPDARLIMPPRKRGTPAREQRRAVRSQELTDAALALFVEKGFAATRLDEIAALAGVSKGTLYLYFDSKEALFLAVIREGIVPLLDEGRKLIDAHADDPLTLLREYIHGWWTLLGSTALGGVPKLMMSEAQNFPDVAQYYLEEVIQPARAQMREILERGVARGVFRAVDIEMMTHILIAPLLHLVMWRHSFAACCSADALDPQRYLDCAIDVVIDGIAAPPRGNAQ